MVYNNLYIFQLQNAFQYKNIILLSLWPTSPTNDTQLSTNYILTGTIYNQSHPSVLITAIFSCLRNHIEKILGHFTFSVTRHSNTTGRKFESWWQHSIKIIPPDEDIAQTTLKINVKSWTCIYVSTLFFGNAKYSEHNPFKFGTKRN